MFRASAFRSWCEVSDARGRDGHGNTTGSLRSTYLRNLVTVNARHALKTHMPVPQLLPWWCAHFRLLSHALQSCKGLRRGIKQPTVARVSALGAIRDRALATVQCTFCGSHCFPAAVRKVSASQNSCCPQSFCDSYSTRSSLVQSWELTRADRPNPGSELLGEGAVAGN